MNARKSRLRIPRVSLENHESDEDFVEPQNSEIRGRGGEGRLEKGDPKSEYGERENTRVCEMMWMMILAVSSLILRR